MTVYSIRDLEKISGIKAHTIRIWEQRYGIIEPQRTDTNIRYYLEGDLKFLLNIALLNRNGIKISKIANMDNIEIAQKVAAISEVNFEHSTQLDTLTISMIEMDEYKFDRIVSANIKQIGFERTMMEVILPFLDKLSVLWLTNSIKPAQENFITSLVRQKLIAAIDLAPLVRKPCTKKFVLFLSEGEVQELSLLFIHYLIKSRGHQAIYLGLNLPFEELQIAVKIHQPEYIYTMISESFVGRPVESYLDVLCKAYPSSTFLLSGYQVIKQQIKSTEQVKVLNSIEDTIDFLNQEV